MSEPPVECSWPSGIAKTAIIAARIYGRRDQLDELSRGYVIPEVAHAKRERREQLDGIMAKIETLREELRTLMQAEMRVGQEN